MLLILDLFRLLIIVIYVLLSSMSQWSRGLWCSCEVVRLLRLWVRIPLRGWMFVCCECCVLSGRGLCEELITRPEESYRLWYVVVFDLETSWMRRPWPTWVCRAKNKKKMYQSKTIQNFLKDACAINKFTMTELQCLPRIMETLIFCWKGLIII